MGKSTNNIAKQLLDAFNSNSQDLPDLLNKMGEENSPIPSLQIEWLKDGVGLGAQALLDQKSLFALNELLDDKISGKIKQLVGNPREGYSDYLITKQVLFEIIQHFEKSGYSVFTSVLPREWYHVLIPYKIFDEIVPWVMRINFDETKSRFGFGSGEGEFEEFFSGFDKPLGAFLSDEFSHLSDFFTNNSHLIYKEMEDDFLGKTVISNFEILNLNEASYNACKTGIGAVKKFC